MPVLRRERTVTRLVLEGFAGPGHRDREGGQRQYDEQAVWVDVWQAGVLQGFPADYPWRGTRTAQPRQVGDAVPPPLAAAVVGELLGIDWRRTSQTASQETP